MNVATTTIVIVGLVVALAHTIMGKNTWRGFAEKYGKIRHGYYRKTK